MITRVQTVGAFCRFASDLQVIPDILTNIPFQRQGDKQWAFGYVLNTNRHIMLCPGSAFQPICDFDKFSFRPTLASSNVSDVFATGDCNQGMVIQTSDTNDFVFGVKVKFEQDYVSLGRQNPAAKTFLVTVHTPNFVVGQNYDAGQLQVTSVADSPD
jgi:hypothetical protein